MSINDSLVWWLVLEYYRARIDNNVGHFRQKNTNWKKKQFIRRARARSLARAFAHGHHLYNNITRSSTISWLIHYTEYTICSESVCAYKMEAIFGETHGN